MRRIILGFIGGGIALALALTPTPAAAINIPACGGDFVLFGLDIVLEQSPATLINGNIMNPKAGGKVSIGNQNTINGTVSGDFLKLGSGVTVTTCATNHLTLGENSVCGSVVPFAACPVAFPPPPLVVPNVPTCVNGAPPAGFVTQNLALLLPTGTTATLPPGCYGPIIVDKDAHLVLTSGQVYDVKQIRVRTLGSIAASVAGSKATLNVQGEFITAAQVKLTDLDLNIQSSGTQHAWNENVLTNVIVNQPLGTFHIHSGSVCVGCELVALKLDVQPITTPVPPPGLIECTCPAGSSLLPGANSFICQ